MHCLSIKMFNEYGCIYIQCMHLKICMALVFVELYLYFRLG